MSECKKLYRVQNGKMIAGVCVGIGRYFNIDPTIVRLVWVILAFMFGSGIFVYLIAWIVIPIMPEIGPGYIHYDDPS